MPLCWGLSEPQPRGREGGSGSRRWGVSEPEPGELRGQDRARPRGPLVRERGLGGGGVEPGVLCLHSWGAPRWAENRTREGNAVERKPEAGGREGEPEGGEPQKG